MRRRNIAVSPFREPREGVKRASPEGQAWRERIARVFDRLSAGNQKVARFLIENPTEAAFMTGSELSERLETDPATVVRFAQSLGYPGYPELSAEIRASVQEIFKHAHELQAGEA